MSVIYITEHNESIYDAIKKKKKKEVKPPIHISVFTKAAQHHYKTNKEQEQQHASMGVAEVERPDPKNFLKKASKTKFKVTKRTKGEKCTCDKKKDTVKKEEDKKETSKKKWKNFIKQNKLSAFNTPPFKQDGINYVFTRNGEKKSLLESGLIPKYMSNKHAFGKPPTYLLKRMRHKEASEVLMNDLKEIKALPKCRYITRQERQELLLGLKKNWEQTQKQYQLLPIITDTIPKINKKVKIEKELAQIEKDISLIEKHEYIYIDDGEPSENSSQ